QLKGLLSLRLSRLFLRSGGVIGNRFYAVLVDWLRALAGKTGAGRNYPTPFRPGTSASSANLYTAGINRLFGFAAREIRFGIDPAFGGQVLTLFRRFSIAD